MLLRALSTYNLEVPEDRIDLGKALGYKLATGEDASQEWELIKTYYTKKWTKSTLGRAIILFKKRKEEDD